MADYAGTRRLCAYLEEAGDSVSLTKNLYIAEADVDVWRQADHLAKHTRQSLSKIVTTALRSYLPTDIRIAAPTEVVTAPAADGVPVLEFGRHPQGIGWQLWYPAAAGGSAVEVRFFPDEGAVPIEEARAYLRQIHSAAEISDADQPTITVEVGDPPLTVGFAGRWLVEPDRDATRTGIADYDAGAYWGIALTRRGRIAVYVAHCNERWPAHLNDFDGLGQAADEVPSDIIAQAAAELGDKHIVWRDI